jgi:IclR family transcriptional regulator, KDG regulon repressor
MGEKVPRIQIIHKAVVILRAFTPDSPELGVRELATKIGIPKSTVHRLLLALESEGLVDKSPETGRYRLGLALVAIAGTALRNLDVRRLALRHMNRLSERWGETIDLDVLRGTHILIIEQIPGQHILSTGGSLASLIPAHCTSTGKVLLAHAGTEFILKNLPEKLHTNTPHTIATRTALLEELEIVRRQGYAEARGENEEYVHALAVPIRDRTGKVVASMSISGLAARIDEKTAEEMIIALQQVAADIAGSFG